MAKPYSRSDPRGRHDRSVSIAQVAQHAGVSVATVSRVLNSSEAVREHTRQHVMESVQVLGYRVNQLARSLRTDESRLLLALVPDIDNPFYAPIVHGFNAIVQEKGYSVLLCETGGDALRERRYLDLLYSRRADGAVCLDPDTVQKAMGGAAMHFPWVACCEYDESVAVPYVGIDNCTAAHDAVSYLVGQGHTRIAFVNSDTRFMYARERLKGYQDALQQVNIACRPDYCVQVQSLDFAAGRQAAASLLALDQRPTAVFAVSDTLAIGVMRGLYDAGLRVPDDMAVMGFDDIALAQQTWPALTTVAQPMRTLGEQAAWLLLKRLDDGTGTQGGVVLPHRLVIRESA
ncbi:LacI family DNA-binding transcriptional regulator [Alcaligenaceae bacterium]|nr:LacI family DNA-binding transcriptional regulator [Alcaligenaceae bacterium]